MPRETLSDKLWVLIGQPGPWLTSPTGQVDGRAFRDVRPYLVRNKPHVLREELVALATEVDRENHLPNPVSRELMQSLNDVK
jgi:hypothetical protein